MTEIFSFDPSKPEDVAKAFVLLQSRLEVVEREARFATGAMWVLHGLFTALGVRRNEAFISRSEIDLALDAMCQRFACTDDMPAGLDAASALAFAEMLRDAYRGIFAEPGRRRDHLRVVPDAEPPADA